MTSFDIAALVSRLARRDRTTEADIQSDIRTLLLHGGLDLGTDDVVTMESQAGAGKRIDVEVGYCVIEVKRDDLETRPDRRRLAEEQLAGYLRQRHDLTGQQHSGILTDGANWYLYRLSAEGLQQIGTFRLRADNPDAEGLCTWLEDVIATRQRINPTPDVVAQKLGYRSVSFDLALAQLRDIYEACRHMPEVQIKRELWARLLRSALGENFTNDDELFIRHTYLVVTAELIAHAAIGHRLDGISYDAATLLSGKLFGDADIGGVVEADFFDWPLHSPDGPKYVLELARRLGRFSWENVDHDVLKVLYESVIDAETRHSLGEYYTPDWLAEKMVAEAVTDPLDQRVLDPACGSGTFLFWAVRRYLKAAEAAGLSNIEALEGVCRQVTGVDLHPVAVTLARVTYLLALQDRLHHPEGRPEIRIPVYLGDSVQWEEDPTLLGSGGLGIRTTQDQGEMFAQEIRFPDSVVADAANFDRLVDALVTRATTRTSTAVPNIDAILAAHGVTGSDRDTVTEAFEILCRLHDDRRNHIWGYYIRNQARPAWLSRPENRVDVLVGNPPWLAYRYMDAGRQERFRELAGERGLWAGAEVATHQDLSALFVVRAVELYLREGGSFAFVMPAAALSRRQFAGFRRGEYHTETQRTAVAFGEPWDLTEVEPTIFPVPASVIFGERTPHPQPLGLKARAWSGTLGSHFARWEAVADKLVEVATVTAVADDAPTSPYSRIFSQGATLVPRVLVTVTEADPGPLGTKAGTTRVASARSSLEKKPWKNLDGLVHTVEDEFLRPMYVGTSIVPYRAWDPGMAVVPYADGKLLSGQDPDIDRYPGLASWWRDAERLWEKNKASGSQMTLRDRIDYQRTLINQFPIAPQRVVYTKAGTNLVAARINDTRAVIDHKLYWAAVGSTEEALFLCAILNSEALRLRVRPLQSRGQFGPRDFDKYVFCIPFPNYDPDNPAHVTIADLGARAEEVSMSVEIPPGVNYQTARRQVSDALTADGVAEEIEEKVSALLEEAVREAAEAALD